MALSTILSHCITQWKEEGLKPGPPVIETEVRRVWAHSKQEMSADVVELYATIGGFHEYAFDNDLCWSFWPWDYLQQRNQESPGIGVKFCDHSIEVVTWEIRYETAMHSSVWSSHESKTADTLESFFALYLENPWQIMK